MGTGEWRDRMKENHSHNNTYDKEMKQPVTQLTSETVPVIFQHSPMSGVGLTEY